MPSGFDRRRERGSDDPSVVRSVAVGVDDVVTALEARTRVGRRVVLRVTPPFAPRMRARLHVDEEPYDDNDTAPVHLDPGTFVDDDAPLYPDVDRTEDELRREGAYSVEAHRERHATAVDAWRRAIEESLQSTVELSTPAGTRRVEAKYLGSVGDDSSTGE